MRAALLLALLLVAAPARAGDPPEGPVLRQAAVEPQPQHVLTKEGAWKLAVKGFGLVAEPVAEALADTTPYGRLYRGGRLAEDVFFDVSEAAVASQNALVESGLVLAGRRMDRLAEIHAERRSLRTDPEAQRLLAEIAASSPQAGSEYTFYRRAMSSRHTLYDAASVGAWKAAEKALGHVLGEWAQRKLGIAEKVRHVKANEGLLSRIRRGAWPRLRQRARRASTLVARIERGELEHALEELVSKPVVEAIHHELDAAYDDIMRRNPSSPAPARARWRPADLRMMAALRPAEVLPAIAPRPQAVMIAPRPQARLVAPEIRAAPAAAPVIVVRDPVLRPIVVDDQLPAVVAPRRSDPPPEPPPPPPPPQRSHPALRVNLANHCQSRWDGNHLKVCN